MSVSFKKKQAISIRPYQQVMIDKTSLLFNQPGPTKILLNLPTGAGKTFVATYSLIQNYISRGKSVIWLANKWHHILQFLKTLDDNLVSSLKGLIEVRVVGQHSTFQSLTQREIDLSLKHFRTLNSSKIKIYVSTVQTLGRLDRQSELSLILKDLDVAVIDEAHWGVHGDLRMRIEDRLHESRIPCMALTATPKRGYSYELVGDKEISYVELAKKGYLAKCVVHSVATSRVYADVIDTGLSSIEKYAHKIKMIGEDFYRNSKIADVYRSKKNEWGKTIIFCGSIEQADAIALLLNCPSVHSGRFDGIALTDIIHRFRTSSDFSVMTTVNMLNDGVDIPELKSIFLAFPTSSDVRFVQMNGRATRNLNGEKPYYNLVDFYDTFLSPNMAKYFDESLSWYEGTFNSDADVDTLSRECIALVEKITSAREVVTNPLKMPLDGSDDTTSQQKVDKAKAFLSSQILKSLKKISEIYIDHISSKHFKELEALGDRIAKGEFGYSTIYPAKEISVFFDLHFNGDFFLPATYLKFQQEWNPETSESSDYFYSGFHTSIFYIDESPFSKWAYASDCHSIFKRHLISKKIETWMLHYKASKASQLSMFEKNLNSLLTDDALLKDLLDNLSKKSKKAA